MILYTVTGTPYIVVIVAFTTVEREENDPHTFFSHEESSQRPPDDVKFKEIIPLFLSLIMKPEDFLFIQ